MIRNLREWAEDWAASQAHNDPTKHYAWKAAALLAEDKAGGEPESFERWNAKQHGDPEEIGFLQALRVAYCAGQESVYRTRPKPQAAHGIGKPV